MILNSYRPKPTSSSGMSFYVRFTRGWERVSDLRWIPEPTHFKNSLAARTNGGLKNRRNPKKTLKKCQKLGLRSNLPPSADTLATFRASVTECFGRLIIGKHQQSVQNLKKPPKPNKKLEKCQKLGLRSNWPPFADTLATSGASITVHFGRSTIGKHQQ